MIDKELSRMATFEDGILLQAAHPVGSKVLAYAGSKWRLKKLPMFGTVISDASLIREIFMDNENFSVVGELTSTGVWNPIIGEFGLLNVEGEDHPALKKVVSQLFSKERVTVICETASAPVFERISVQIKKGEKADLVKAAEEISYLSMWHLIGLSEAKLQTIDFTLAVKTLRAVTEGLNPRKKKLSQRDIDTAKGRLTFLDVLIREAYNDASKKSVPQLLREEGCSEEEAVSLTKSFFLAGTEVVISFLPRMAALFIKSGYMDYLKEHPDHIMKGVEEAFRVTTPTPVAVRVATASIDFHGVKIKKGERIILSSVAASKRFGDFNPFNDVDENIKELWFGAGMLTRIGTEIALSQSVILGAFLSTLNEENKLVITSQASDDKGHTGSYKEMVITCTPS